MEGALAFVCAMPLEVAAMARAAGLRRDPRKDIELRRGTAAGVEAVAIGTGMGTDLARRSTERLLDAVAVRHVLVVGIAGGVDTTTPIGTVVRPEIVIDAATGTEHRPTQPDGVEPRGALWTTDSITSAAELPGLQARGVIALDMETASIAAVCRDRGVPWSVFRAISDDPSDEVDAELFAMSNPDGSPNPGRVLRYVVRHPGRVPRLARMGRHSKLAADRAAAAAVAACRELA
jgi:adenosylhomocysteine nucleosidase